MICIFIYNTLLKKLEKVYIWKLFYLTILSEAFKSRSLSVINEDLKAKELIIRGK